MGRKIRLITAAILMITSILVTQIPAVDVNAAKTDIGDFTFKGDTLIEYRGKEEVLTIPNATITIGHDAFSGNETIKEVVIPDSVKTIDFAAFENCKNLQTVQMGESVKTIGSSAFSGCTNLKNVNLPKKVSDIGSGAFAKCESLSNIKIEAGNDDFVCTNGVLYNHDMTKLVQYLAGTPAVSYQMPSTVKKIDEYAFWGASLLTDLTISSAVKELPEYAFDHCSSLTEVTIPSSVESIYAYAFGDCDNLKTVYLPKSVGYVDDDAFASSRQAHIVSVDDSGDQSVSLNAVTGQQSKLASQQQNDTLSGNQTATFSSDQNNVSVENANHVTPYSDFSENVGKDDLGTSKIVGGQAFMLMPSNLPVRGVNLNSMESEDSLANAGSIDDPGQAATPSESASYDVISGVLTDYTGSGDLTLPNQINRIGDRVFYTKQDIQTVNLPSSVDSVGDFAFARSSLQQVALNEGLDQIGYAAFYHCQNLNQVEIPDSVNKIELGAFEGTPWLENWMSSANQDTNDFLIVGDGILLAYRGNDTSVQVPDGVKSIGAECFQNCQSLTQIEFPDSVIRIGEDAFHGCHMLKEMNLPANLVTIEDRAFKDCAFSQVEIPSGVASIGLGAFDMTGNGYPLQTVIFDGTILPNVTFNETATRLSGSDMRTAAFNGVHTAVISADTTQLTNTILDCNQNGFRGMVYQVSKLPEGTEPGQLELIKCTVEPDAADGIARLNSRATINQQPYLMTAVRPEAFDDYQSVESWSGLHLTGIDLTGNAADDLTELLNRVPVTSTPGSAYTLDDPVFIYSSDERIEHIETASASLNDHTDPYMLVISNKEEASNQMNMALANHYSSINGMTIFPMDISMYGAIDMIPIKKMAQNKMELTMPLPSQFANPEQVKVATVDSNGKLEPLSSGLVEQDGIKCIKFVVSHFSAFAFYTVPAFELTETSTVISTDGQAFLQHTDIVVKQLTKGAAPVKMKWIVAFVLALMSICLCLISKKRIKKN